MKRILFSFLLIFVISLNSANAVEVNPYFVFKYHLHNLFEGYSNMRRSADLKKYDEMEKSLRNVAKSVEELRKVVPKKNIDGYKIDRIKITLDIEKLNDTVQGLILASDNGELNETKLFTEDMFNICLNCHTRGRLQYLFNLTLTRTPFSNYLHDLVEYMNVTKSNIASGVNPRKNADSANLIYYYLELLEGDFPEKGASGAIANKDDFNQRIKEAKYVWEKTIKKGTDIKMDDLINFKKVVNGICVYCHEPERIN